MESVELDGGAEGAGPAEQPESPHFEIDLSIPAERTQAPRQARAEAAAPDPVQSELAQLREQFRTTQQRADLAYSGIAPYIATLQRTAQGPQEPSVTVEQLLHDPNVTTKELIQFIQQENSRHSQEQRQAMEFTARRGASELEARGKFQGEGFEGGYDFDSLVNKYVHPLYERMPFMRDFCFAMNPEKPAQAEYGLATLLAWSAAAKDDPVTFYKRAWAFLRGEFDNQGEKITEAAKTAAARIARGGSGRQTAGRTHRLDADAIKDMSDRDFEALERQVNG